MSDDSCPCCGSLDERNATERSAAIEWHPEGRVLEGPLPEELRAALGRFYGGDPVETLGEWADEVRGFTDGDAIAIDDLCQTDRETAHRGEIGATTRYFECFYDAVILAALTDEPVDIRTESSGGETIEARAIGTDTLTVDPPEAVFSFGIDENAALSPGTTPTLEDGYAAICPYVRAFPSRAAYERWAATVPAATVALPLEGATELANRLAE